MHIGRHPAPVCIFIAPKPLFQHSCFMNTVNPFKAVAHPFKRMVDFFYEIGSARKQPRSWSSKLQVPTANVAEHTYRTAYLAMYLATENGADPYRAAVMALVHDSDEVRTGDLDPWQKMYITVNGTQAIKDLFAGTPMAGMCLSLAEEYKKRETMESKCVKDADILDTIIEMHELAANGSGYLESSIHLVHQRRDFYFTETARQLHDAVIHSGPTAIWDWFHEGESTFSKGTYGK